MKDVLGYFGDVAVTADGTAVEAPYAVDLIAEGKDDYFHDWRVVLAPKATVTGSFTANVLMGDSKDAMEIVESHKFTNPTIGEPIKFPYPLEHKQYMGISIAGDAAVTIEAATEQGA